MDLFFSRWSSLNRQNVCSNVKMCSKLVRGTTQTRIAGNTAWNYIIPKSNICKPATSLADVNLMLDQRYRRLNNINQTSIGSESVFVRS